MNSTTDTYTVVITKKDVYGEKIPPIPEGMREVGFRPPKTGDKFIADTCLVDRALGDFWDKASPRIILEPIPVERRCGTCRHGCPLESDYMKDHFRCHWVFAQPNHPQLFAYGPITEEKPDCRAWRAK